MRTARHGTARTTSAIDSSVAKWLPDLGNRGKNRRRLDAESHLRVTLAEALMVRDDWSVSIRPL